MKIKLFYSFILAFAVISCTNNSLENSKVSGRVSDNNAPSNVNSQKVRSNVSSTGVSGATVVLAEVQADGSLKTVSTQSVQTDVNGRFEIETTSSGIKNLVVVATKGSDEWKSVVSAEVKSGTTVYAQPLNSESTAEAELYARVVAKGKANVISTADIQLYVNADVAMQIEGNTALEDQVIAGLEARSQANTQAFSNSSFGVNSVQLSAAAALKAEAQIAFETALYNSTDSVAQSAAFIVYQKAIISAYTVSGISVETYAKIDEMSSQAYINANASASMSSQLALACAKSEYMKDAIVIQQAMDAKFQTVGATSAQSTAVATAGVTLSAAINSSTSVSQIKSAFVQYHTTIVDQLKAILSVQASVIASVDSNINGVVGAKATLTAAIGVSSSASVIVNAFIAFNDAVKVLVQNSLATATSTQISSSAEILILASFNG